MSGASPEIPAASPATDVARLQEAVRHWAQFAASTIDAISAHLCVLDRTGKIVAVNAAWRKFYDDNSPLAAPASNYGVGTNYLGVCAGAINAHSEEAEPVADGVCAVINGEIERFSLEYPCHSATEQRWFNLVVTPFQDASGHVVLSHENITKRKLAEDRLREMAQHDFLTGLPNRSLFSDRLQQAITNCRRNGSRLAFLFIDLDRFKPINDTLGHAVGDLLLQELALRMTNCVRDSDTIARIGGDEFVALLRNVDSEESAFEVGEKLRLAISQPFDLAGQLLGVSASIGIALYPDHGSNELELSTHADMAMYCAKNNGRDNVRMAARR
jgi:diguanylate cyclase (GGDEF)-like protein